MNFDLHLTTDCNMKCNFCAAWEYGRTKHFIPLEEAKNALDQARRNGYRITTLTGGEPTMHPDFCEILNHAHSIGLWSVVTTNGLYLTKGMINTYKKCATLVRISLHSLDADQHANITGSDTFSSVLSSLDSLVKNSVNIAIGCTVFTENLNQVVPLAKFAWENGVHFIRYTPVVGMRGAENIKLQISFFSNLLEKIFRICVNNGQLLEYRTTNSPSIRKTLLNYMMTRRCAGGSSQHIIHDSQGRMLPCSFIPEQMQLYCPGEGTVTERIQKTREKMNNFQSKYLKDNLKGKCSECEFADLCLGGCLTTKIAFGFEPNAEQPVCLMHIVNELLQKFDPKEQVLLMDYWSSVFKRKAPVTETEKNCMRHLPIWEIVFRSGIDSSQYRFNGGV